MPENTAQAPGPVTTNFSRRVAYALGLSVLMLLGAVVFTANWIAAQHDQLARENSYQVVGSAMTSMAERTESLGFDYSHWDPYYAAVLGNDIPWLYENTVGGDLVEGSDIEMLIHILPGHQIARGWSIRHNGSTPHDGIVAADLLATINPALDATEINSKSVLTSYEVIDGELWILATSRIVPWDGVDATIADQDVPRQILGARVTQDQLDAMADRFFLQGIALSFDAPLYPDHIVLKSTDGTAAAYVAWLPPVPGAQILREVPIAVLAVVSCIILILLVGAFHLHKSAKTLEDALRAAMQANRHKDEFIATISHELRTPLTSVTASISMLLNGMLGKLPDKVIEVLEVCERNNGILGSLIEDLLLIGAIDSGNSRIRRERIDLNALLKESIENTEGYMGSERVEIALDLEDQPVFVDVDERKFNQVISNLLSNAAKFSSAGSTVRVALETSVDKIRILVTDSGIGIPDGHEDDVFGRFRQVDNGEGRKHNGTGIGLSISREIVDAHSGTLTYESEVGVGTRFIVELPRSAQTDANSSDEPHLGDAQSAA